MAQLKVMLGKKLERSILLDTPRLTIGRAADANLVLESEIISRVHAQVTWDGEQHRIEDLLSKTGVLVNDERTTNQALRDGDQIAIGKYTLVYDTTASTEGATPSSQLDASSEQFWKEGLAASGHGPVMTSGSHKPAAAASVSASHLQAVRAPDTDDDFKGTMMVTGDEMQKVRATLLTSQGPHLKVRVEGSFERIPVGGDPVTIGYFDGATFRLPGSKWLGKEQCRVDTRDDVVYLTTLSFWSKVAVDGRRVKGRVELRPGATIAVGPVKFHYSDGGEL